MTGGFLNWSITRILKELAQGSLSPTEVARLCIEQVQTYEADCQAWVCFDEEKLLKQAGEIEKRFLTGETIRALEGIPLGVKDIINVLEFPTEMGSPTWKGFTPGHDARVIYYAKQAGAVIPGKTVTAEFAVHTLGKTLNPHNPLHMPGTSSSGSAVAVALGMVPAALGTQTAGSIVRPASFCGIYGCKPSFGLIPRTGILKTTDSLDTVGFFTTHFEDLQPLFEVLRVHGPNYPMSHTALSDRTRQFKPAQRPWKIGIAKTHVWSEAADYAQRSLLSWTSQLAEIADIHVEEVTLPVETENSHEIHSIIYNKTLAYYFKEEFKQSELVSPIMQALISEGNRCSLETYKSALKSQEQMAKKMDDLLTQYDVLISLSTAGEAPLRDQQERRDPSLLWNMTYLPTISAPVFTSPSGLPFGVQLVSRRYNDILLFNFANHLNQQGLLPNGPNPLAAQLLNKPIELPV